MKKGKAYNEAVCGDEGFAGGEGYPSCEGEPCANVAVEQEISSDTMADEDQTPAQMTGDDAAEWRDKFLRLQAEFDNYRKRTLREKMELIENGGKEVLKAVLPVRDDVQRAVVAMGKSDDIAALREGVNLISQKFTETLRQKRVVEIEAIGREFDSDLYEAVARFAAGEEHKGKVIDVVQPGYMLGESVLRFAKVVVGE